MEDYVMMSVDPAYQYWLGIGMRRVIIAKTLLGKGLAVSPLLIV